MLIGSHLSVAGGLHKALEKAHAYGFGCLAIFVRNQLQWRCPPLSEEAVELFRRRRKELRIGPIVAHGSYLVNLAGRGENRKKSIAAMIHDLGRCDRLGVESLVFHPGFNPRPETGKQLIADALNRIVTAPRPRGAEGEPPMILLETVAGARNCIGDTFEELADVLGHLEQPERFGVCLDTCHVFAAGYDIRTSETYRRTMKAFDAAIGLRRLRAIHLNDAKGRFGSRWDRHAHIGMGQIGREGFANFVNDRRLARVPMVLETPKGLDEQGRDWDEINFQTLQSLKRSRL